jgi:hypothetical protein
MSRKSSNTNRGSWLGDDLWSKYLDVTSPESSEALAKIGDIINVDLLLPSWFKHIIVAATAAIKSQPQDCAAWTRSALNAGATIDNIFSAAITLVLSRGIFPARMLIESLIQVSPKIEMTASPRTAYRRRNLQSNNILSQLSIRFPNESHSSLMNVCQQCRLITCSEMPDWTTRASHRCNRNYCSSQ